MKSVSFIYTCLSFPFEISEVNSRFSHEIFILRMRGANRNRHRKKRLKFIIRTHRAWHCRWIRDTSRWVPWRASAREMVRPHRHSAEQIIFIHRKMSIRFNSPRTPRWRASRRWRSHCSRGPCPDWSPSARSPDWCLMGQFSRPEI